MIELINGFIAEVNNKLQIAQLSYEAGDMDLADRTLRELREMDAYLQIKMAAVCNKVSELELLLYLKRKETAELKRQATISHV